MALVQRTYQNDCFNLVDCEMKLVLIILLITQECVNNIFLIISLDMIPIPFQPMLCENFFKNLIHLLVNAQYSGLDPCYGTKKFE